MDDPFITAIFEKEHLTCDTIQPINGGQINLVYRVGDSLILRAARTVGDSNRLMQESNLLQYIRRHVGSAIPVPQVVASGEYDGRAYQVQTRIPGSKLHRTWLNLSNPDKDRIMAQLAESLEALHALSFENYGWFHEQEITYPSWTGYLETCFSAAMENIERYSNHFPAFIRKKAVQLFTEHLPLFRDCCPSLVHADLWPGNILVDGSQITGILDFEFALRAPREYELVLIEDFCLYPNDFVEEDFEMRSISDYADFFQLLVRHTPSLFAIPKLRERLDLYHILFNLQLIAGWCKNNPDQEEDAYLLAKLTRITNMLNNHGSRMFKS